MRPSDTEEIAIVGMQATEARELALAAEAVGLAVRLLAFGSPLADAAFAAHGPGSVRLPLAIVAGRYSLQRPAFGTVLECIEVLRGTRLTLPAGCVVLASTADRDGHEQPAIEPKEPDRVLHANFPRRSMGGVARRSATLATAAARLGDNHHPSRIWIANADGSRQHQLAGDARGFRDLFPRYTLSGRTIVFSRCLPNDGDCAIWTMHADGTHLHALTPYVTSGVDQHNDFGSAISPNGRRIAFTRFEAHGIAAQVYVMNADGSHPHAITPPGLEGGAPNWSSDGHLVAFNSNQSRTGSRIFTVRPDGTGLRALTPDLYPHNETGPSYSPHGSRIAFASDRRYGDGCRFDLFEMKANGTGQHRIHVGLRNAGIVDPVWGPAVR